ncbi:MAG: PH domain-containing protein, partial [Christensenellales bacterium]
MVKYDNDAEILWQDRKRWCGMPITFTRYSLVKKTGQHIKLVNVNGFLTTRTEEVKLFRVDDIGVYQSFINKIFGVGTITIYCNDASCSKLELRNIKNPFKVRELISDYVTQERQRVGMR